MNTNTEGFIKQAEEVYKFLRGREEAITRTKVHTVGDFKAIIQTAKRIAEEIIVKARSAAKAGVELDTRALMSDLKYLKRVSVAGRLTYEGHTTDERYHAEVYSRLLRATKKNQEKSVAISKMRSAAAAAALSFRWGDETRQPSRQIRVDEDAYEALKAVPERSRREVASTAVREAAAAFKRRKA